MHLTSDDGVPVPCALRVDVSRVASASCIATGEGLVHSRALVRLLEQSEGEACALPTDLAGAAGSDGVDAMWAADGGNDVRPLARALARCVVPLVGKHESRKLRKLYGYVQLLPGLVGGG